MDNTWSLIERKTPLTPFFTVLTASLNSNSTIRKTLTSVLEQSFGNLEHIVIDGGSSDQTVDILREYEQRYNVRWISEPDSGIPSALNKGLRLAKGKYILVLQADDHFAGPEVLEKVHPLIKQEHYDINIFPVYKLQPSNRRILHRPFRIRWWYHFKTIFPHQGSFIHRRVYERLGDFREDLVIVLDYDFFYRALKSRSTVKLHDYPVAIMGGEGISSNRDFLLLRLREESYVQSLNETNPFWRAMQSLFRTAYMPYKTRFVPYWRTHFVKSGKVGLL
jgi:glycosyltransferase involved in cell wall biosynthesis